MEHQLSTDALSKIIVTNQTTELPPGPPLPEGYEVGPLDICNGRGKSNWNVQGNVSFRNYIQQKVHLYINIQSKLEKTQFVNDAVHELRSQGYRFLSEDGNNRFFDIGDAQAKSKVGHSLRDQVAAIRKAIHGGGVGATPAMLLSSSSSSTTATGELSSSSSSSSALAAAVPPFPSTTREVAMAAASDQSLYTEAAATPTPTIATIASATTTTATAVAGPATQPSAVKKPRRVSEEKLHLAALRTTLADLQHERRENARLSDENANLRKEAEKSRVEFFDLKAQVHNLSAVVRELWSRQGGTLNDLRFLSSDTVQVVARTVGLLPNAQPQGSDKDDDRATPAMEQDPGKVASGREETHYDRPPAANDVK